MNPDVLEDLLACPVCMELPEKEVFECPEGHVVCSKCVVRLRECPFCMKPYGSSRRRCRVVESLLESRIFPCRHHGLGCSRRLTRKELEAHFATCAFKPQGQPITPGRALQPRPHLPLVQQPMTEEEVEAVAVVFGLIIIIGIFLYFALPYLILVGEPILDCVVQVFDALRLRSVLAVLGDALIFLFGVIVYGLSAFLSCYILILSILFKLLWHVGEMIKMMISWCY